MGCILTNGVRRELSPEVLIVCNVTCDKNQIMRERSGRNNEI